MTAGTGVDRARGSAGSRRGRTREREAVQERCDLCGEPVAPRAPPPARRSQPRADVRLPRLHDPLRTAAAASAGHYRLVPDRRLRARRPRAGRPGLGGAAAAGRRSRSSSARRRRRARAGVLPEPDGRRRSRRSSSTRGRRSRPPTRSCATLEPDVEALLVNRARGARRHWIVPIDDCYALVGRHPHALARADRRRGGVAEIARFFEGLDRRARPASRNDGDEGSRHGEAEAGQAADADGQAHAHEGHQAAATRPATTSASRATCPTAAGRRGARPASTRTSGTRSTRACRTSPRARPCGDGETGTVALPELGFAVQGAAPLAARRRADARLHDRDRGGGGPGGPLGAARRPGPDRRPPARATTRTPMRACSRSSARWPAGARRCARCCGRAPRWSSRRSRAPRRSSCRCRAATTWRCSRRSTSTRSRTASCRSSSCSAARCSTRAPAGMLQVVAHLLGAGGGLRAAGGGVAGDDGARTSRASRGCAWTRSASTACARSSRAARWPRGRTRSTRCCRRAETRRG